MLQLVTIGNADLQAGEPTLTSQQALNALSKGLQTILTNFKKNPVTADLLKDEVSSLLLSQSFKVARSLILGSHALPDNQEIQKGYEAY